jgi:drug/metabolite transporter (DMT)-like permease
LRTSARYRIDVLPTALTRSFRLVTGNAYVLLLLTTLLWAGNAVASPMAVGHLSPMTLVLLRWLVSCSVLLVIAQDAIKRDWPVLKQHLPFLFFMGALGYTGFNLLFYIAGHYTTAINIAILQGTMPVMIIVAGLLVFGEKPTWLQWSGTIVTVLGVVAVASSGDIARLLSLNFNYGDVLVLLATVLYAGYAAALRKRPQVSALGFFAFMAGAAVVSSLPPAIYEIASGQAMWPTWQGWLLILYIGLGPSLLAQLMFMRGVQLIGPTRAAIFTNIVPVMGPVLAVLILGEKFSLHHAVGLALVLGGIVIAERGKGA